MIVGEGIAQKWRTRMFKKAHRYDEEVLFYFDENDNKYVATGGSIAWRTNNPGLIHSRDPLAGANNCIGAYHQVAIFPSIRQGMCAFRARMNSQKFRSSLLEIAKYYQSNTPDLYADDICKIAGLPKDINFRKLTTQEFEQIILAVQHLTGFTDKRGSLCALPKITARYHPSGGGADFYVVGFEELISKDETIHRVETHRLDAVMVHKSDGGVYLRSRPGHRLDSIRFVNHELNEQPDFKDVMRDTGKQIRGQCIWGYINGINNPPEEAKAVIQVISTLTKGEHVWSLANDKKWFLSLGNVGDVCFQKLDLSTEVAKFAVLFFRFLFEVSDNDPSHPPVIIFAHSQGAIISSVALRSLSQQERQRIRIFTFGGGSFISSGKAHPDSHNFASSSDLVCLFASPNLRFLALQRYFGSKEGLSEHEVIRQLALTDAMFDLDTVDKKAIETYTNQRIRYYEKEFSKIRNVTILDPDPHYMHQFCSSCYQSAIQTIIKRYQHL